MGTRRKSETDAAADGAPDNPFAVKTKYMVHRAFAWKGVFYTAHNAGEIEQLPKEIIKLKLEDGSISETEQPEGGE